MSAGALARAWRRLLLPAALATCLSACAISTPFPRVAPGPEDGADAKVLLVLTRAVVDQRTRAAFDEQTRRVMDGMASQPGLLGYSARRQLFGNQAWTMSIWVDEAARERFMRSAVHREAIERSMAAIITVESKRLLLRRQDLPVDWTTALALFEGPGERRPYWE